MQVTAVFLDIDGVLSDNNVLGPEYRRLMGDILAPALGGTRKDWGRANRAVFPDLFAESMAWTGDPTVAARREYRENIERMCAWLGLEAPPPAECERLGREFNIYVRRNAQALFAAAAGVVRELARNLDVHLATGNPSWCGIAVLEHMGVRELVGHPTGPDLVGRMKKTAGFHPAILALAAAAPATSVIVDDDPDVLVNAKAAGTLTVLVAPEGHPAASHIDRVISGIGELPDAIRPFE